MGWQKMYVLYTYDLDRKCYLIENSLSKIIYNIISELFQGLRLSEHSDFWQTCFCNVYKGDQVKDLSVNLKRELLRLRRR